MVSGYSSFDYASRPQFEKVLFFPDELPVLPDREKRLLRINPFSDLPGETNDWGLAE